MSLPLYVDNFPRYQHPPLEWYIWVFLRLFVFCFLGPHPRHMEVPKRGIKLELQLLPYTTATATPEPRPVCDLHHSSWQHWILNPLSEAGDRTCILMDTSQIGFHCHDGNSQDFSFYKHEVGGQWPWPLRLGDAERTRDKVHRLCLDASDMGLLCLCVCHPLSAWLFGQTGYHHQETNPCAETRASSQLHGAPRRKTGKAR